MLTVPSFTRVAASATADDGGAAAAGAPVSSPVLSSKRGGASGHWWRDPARGVREPLLVPLETHPPPVGRAVETEEDILRLLGLPWLPPHLRNA